MNKIAESPFIDLLDDLFVVFDERGMLVEWNRAVEETTGYSERTLASMTAVDFFEGEDVDRIRDAVADVRETGEAIVEAELVTADGERIPHEFKARRVAGDDSAVFAGIGRDVTERRRQREQIENRERTLREIHEIIADRRRPLSDQVESLLELGRAELDAAYGTLSRIEDEDYVFEVVAADDDSIQSGDVVPLAATNCEITATTERTLVLGDVARDAPTQTDRAGYAEWGIACYIGAPVFVEDDVYGTFCFYGGEPRDGQFTDWEVTLVDLMSRWVSHELERRQAQERLQRQNERLERFASLVSHDLRNPLNVVEGSIELAEETGDPEHFERARHAVERMNALIDDLLALAQLGAAIDETEVVDLAALVEQCWENVATEDAALEVETEQTILADTTRAQQLLENLFRNAVEHGGEAVTVTVGDLPDGFYVEDDGPGIPQADRETVFEEGYTTTTGGTGFGLSIVGEIADAHGWNVVLTEGTAGGARFEFTESVT